MVWNKLLEPSMTNWVISCLKMILKEDKLIQHYSWRLLRETYSLWKFRLMILSLVQLMHLFARNFISWCRKSLKWAWWENWNSFWEFKSTTAKMECMFINPKYTKELLKKFKLEDCKEMNTPMHPTCTLSKED